MSKSTELRLLRGSRSVDAPMNYRHRTCDSEGTGGSMLDMYAQVESAEEVIFEGEDELAKIQFLKGFKGYLQKVFNRQEREFLKRLMSGNEKPHEVGRALGVDWFKYMQRIQKKAYKNTRPLLKLSQITGWSRAQEFSKRVFQRLSLDGFGLETQNTKLMEWAKREKDYRKRYYEEHKELERKYKVEHCEMIALYQKKYREENRERLKKYREENRERRLANQRRYCEKHKEKIAELKKIYREKNKEKIKEKNRRYREENKERIREREKKYYEEHKDLVKKYREENKDKIRERKKRYREEHKEVIKKYREENKERIRTRNKEYREQNKEKIKKYLEENKEKRNAYNREYKRRKRAERKAEELEKQARQA